ncbi:MAG: ribbon-helix-helix domain-containing protein [Promethearchaeota archaeon]
MRKISSSFQAPKVLIDMVDEISKDGEDKYRSHIIEQAIYEFLNTIDFKNDGMLKVTSIYLSEDLVKKMKERIDNKEFSSMSDLIRNAIRLFLLKKENKETYKKVATPIAEPWYYTKKKPIIILKE